MLLEGCTAQLIWGFDFCVGNTGLDAGSASGGNINACVRTSPVSDECAATHPRPPDAVAGRWLHHSHRYYTRGPLPPAAASTALNGWLAGALGVRQALMQGLRGALPRTFATSKAPGGNNNDYCLIHPTSLNLPIIPELLSRLALDKSQDIDFMGNMSSSTALVKPRGNVRHFALGLKSEFGSAYHRL